MTTSAAEAPQLAPVKPDPSLFLAWRDLEHHVRLDRNTIGRLISAGKFPPPDVSIGAKIRLWKRTTIESWEQQASE